MIINIQDDILKLHALRLLDRLLQDKATKGNVLWATDAYAHLGDWYSPGNEIRPQRITGENSDLIKTRARRAMEQRTERTRQHAEVFTPLWIVKKMNDVADEQWFGRKTGIYKLTDEGKIYFSKDKHWKLYVDARRLEITCGEAPFLVTRYDVETGEALPIEERIGLLDRKLRVVSENAADIDEWKTWALRAVQAIYGYELQGDNLLIARVNILCSVEEHMVHRWRQKPDKAWLEKLCNVISWNLWQMDGIKGCVPVPPKPTEEQLCLFLPEPQFGLENLFGEKEEKEIVCRLFDWRRGGNGRSISYKALREKGPELMKFDFIIGNPPYQEEQISDNFDGSLKNYAPPIYNHFMDECFMLGSAVELIHPARFLFNAGSTPKAWNEKMLSDKHFKVLFYEEDGHKVFPTLSTPLRGGVAITYRNALKDFGAIQAFTKFPEVNDILHKVIYHKSFKTIMDIVYSRTAYRFTDTMHVDHPEARYKEDENGNNIGLLSKGHDYDMSSNIMMLIPSIFLDVKPDDGKDYIQMLGRINNRRIYKFIRRDYVKHVDNLDFFKVYVAQANGSGEFGETMSDPVVEKPGVGSTETFLSIGRFKTVEEGHALEKYIKTKFARAMLSVLKVTQNGNKPVWKYVPLQDFTPASDIDWSKSIPEIDKQLYAKYGLDDAEIAFIESHVKEMN